MSAVSSASARSRRSTIRRATQALMVLLSLGVGACGDGTGPSGPGTGSATISGAVSASGGGISLFASEQGLFEVLVASTTGTWQIQIANYSGRPEMGTYALTPLDPSSESPTAALYHASPAGVTMYESTSGQLVITSSSASSVRGTFSFTGRDVDGTATVTVQGSFDARCAEGVVCQ
jgi:hypothetical protein